ncbi:uncharacterized protein LOC144644596 [Oculina patagonica]
MEVDEIDEDFFDRNIDQLDVRETPIWELSEEEESAGSDVETLVNQQQTAKKKPNNQVPILEMAQRSIPASTPGANPARNLPLKQNVPIPNVTQTQSPIMKRNPDSSVNNGKMPGSSSNALLEKPSMSPASMYRHPLNKEKIDAMVKSAYKERSDSVKDFGASERGKKPAQLANGQPIVKRDQQENPDVPVWEEDDVDSVKDFTGNDRQKEEKYMERTDEVIYQRAAEEHIRRPPLWHDDEVDSVRDFSRVSGKQEPPSGLASQQLSRLPSDEHICLSPPWNEEDDGPVRPFVTDEPVAKNFSINNMVMEERMRQGQPPPWHEEDDDSTRDFAAQYRKTRSMENSRRPSEENIYLTPPWMEDERQSLGGRPGSDHSSNRSYRMTLEEQRAIQEEVRNTGIAEAGDKVQVLRDEKAADKVVPGVGPPVPGRDSGFCSEQDQLAQQGQGLVADGLTSNTLTQAEPLTTKDIANAEPPVEKPPVTSLQSIKPTPTQTQTSSKPAAEPYKPVNLNPAEDTRHVNQPLPTNREMHVNQPLPTNRERPIMCAAPQDIRSSQDARNRHGGEAGTHRRSLTRSVSQSSLEAICYSPHDALDGLETSSVVSFASTAATHHDLDTRIDMVQSLLSMLGTHDKDDMSRTLLAMSNSKDSCAAMRQSGCLPLLIDLLHGKDLTDKNARREARARAGLALHNIVYSNVEDRRGRREVRVLRLLEIARAHCDVVQFKGFPVHPCAERWYPPLMDYGPAPAIAALMKLSFEEDHRTAICELGGLQAIAELVQIDHQVNEQCKDFYSLSLRKYVGMTITNLTFGNTKNKNLLCSIPGAVDAIIAQLYTVEEEEIVQVSASVLRNLSWRADELCRKTLRDAGAIKALLSSAQAVHGEPALRTTLSALWNLSAHCSDNKAEICASPGALKFLVKCLNYSSPTGNISVVESSGGILRNLSSHIAVRPDYRKTLRDCGCFQIMLSHLRSPSLRVVSNVCGALWNLSARCVEDQELLWELGAVSLLKSLINSKHKAIATASAAALRNLMTVKPGSSTDNESVSSRAARHYRSMPANMRSADAQARIKSDAARVRNRSPRSQSPLLPGQVTQQPQTVRQAAKADYEAAIYSQHGNAASNIQPGLVTQPLHPHGQVTKQTEDCSSQPFPHAGQAAVIPVTRQDIDAAAAHPQQSGRKKNGSSASLAHSSSSSNHGAVQEVEPSPSLLRSRSDVGPRALAGRQRRAKARATDSNSIGSGASIDGRHTAHLKWSQSNDSLSKHRRQPRRDATTKQNYERLDGDPRYCGPKMDKNQHSRSSSDGCAVIPLLCDSYPLHVSHKPKRGDSSKDKSTAEASVLSRIRSVAHRNMEAGSGHSQQGDSTSLVSPSTARRLNQWTSASPGETYELAEFGPQETRMCQAPDQPSTSAARSSSSTARPNQRHTTQKFKSYRDSDSDPDSEMESEEERHLLGHPGKTSDYPEASNAWIQKGKPELHSPRSADTASVTSSTCSCDQEQNVWIRRPHSKGVACGNCSRTVKGSDKYNAKKTMVKSRRDSTDSPISSPSSRRVFRTTSGREQQKEL